MNRADLGVREVKAAARALEGIACRTPIHTSQTLDRLADRQLFFKCENFQRTGAFKFRGAWTAVSRLLAVRHPTGVVTHSSGNHAQALALAASLHGLPSHVIMPNTANRVKREAAIAYGGRIIGCEPSLEAREETAAAVQEELGLALIPPYDHPDIIAGQGTACLELMEQVPDLDGVIAPVGGGGLLSGTALVAQGLKASMRIFGGEPANVDDAARSLDRGEKIPLGQSTSIADGLLTSLGELTWPVIRDRVEEIITVSEAEIVASMKLVWERMKLVIEPSAAVAVAAVLTPTFKNIPKLTRMGVILSGGNTDLEHLPWFDREIRD